VLLPLTAGVLGGGAAACDATVAAWLVLAAAALALGSAVVVVRREHRVVPLALLAGLAAGAARALVAAAPPPFDHVARHAGRLPVAIRGTIVASDRAISGVHLVVRARRYRSAAGEGRVGGDVGVSIAHPARPWDPGTRVTIVGRLRIPRGFGNPDGYDVRRTLARRGILVTMFLWDDRAVEERLPPLRGMGPSAMRALARVRRALGAAIDDAAAEPARGFLHAVLLGEDGAFADEPRRALARTGLSHVTSVSGFHLAAVAAAAVVGLRWLLLRWERAALRWNVAKIAALATVPAIAAYAALAGGSIPASRSLLMYGVLLAALVGNRRTDGLRSLAAAALVLALAVPDVAADISFELSFASVAALILAARLDGTVRPEGGWRRVAALVAASVRVSVAATAATAPLTAWHFQQVSLIAPLANLVALPLLGPATLLPGLCALPLAALAPSAAHLLLRVAAAGASLGLAIAAALAALPGAALETPMPNGFEVGLAYALLLAPLWWRRMSPPPRRCIALALLLLAAGDVGYWAWERLLDPRLRITFLSVGQGDAAVVELPRGGVVVIDGGGMPGGLDVGERVLAPFLHARKVVRLEALALSHPQLDHYGGLAYLAEHFAPREFWSTGETAAAGGFVRLERALDAAGTRRLVLRRGATVLDRDGTRIDVLHPAAPDPRDLNDGSLVLRVVHGAASVLFTGDLERPGELALLAGADVESARSVVLKVPHHGSATSSSAALLAAVAPRLAVISAGSENRFGFPAPAVLTRLGEVGADVWRTDQEGAVQVVADGARLVVSAPSGARPPRVLALDASVHETRFEMPTPLW
jgi:competence protein ComEC